MVGYDGPWDGGFVECGMAGLWDDGMMGWWVGGMVSWRLVTSGLMYVGRGALEVEAKWCDIGVEW